MDDRTVMEDLLLNIKGACDLYLHGTVESSTANVRGAFDKGLEDSLCSQNAIYQKMSAKGWYASEQAPKQNIDTVRQKFYA